MTAQRNALASGLQKAEANQARLSRTAALVFHLYYDI
jgi:hypothetical protein